MKNTIINLKWSPIAFGIRILVSQPRSRSRPKLRMQLRTFNASRRQPPPQRRPLVPSSSRPWDAYVCMYVHVQSVAWPCTRRARTFARCSWEVSDARCRTRHQRHLSGLRAAGQIIRRIAAVAHTRTISGEGEEIAASHIARLNITAADHEQCHQRPLAFLLLTVALQADAIQHWQRDVRSVGSLQLPPASALGQRI